MDAPREETEEPSAPTKQTDPARHGAFLKPHPANRWLRLALLLLVVATLAALLAFNAKSDAVFAWAKSLALACQDIVLDHRATAWLCYLALGVALINCPIPAAALLKLLAGFLFGVAEAWALNLLISVLGCSLGFSVTRHLFYRAFYARYSHALAKANLEIARNGFWYVLACRLFVVMPFFLSNILAGLSSMRLRTFATATALGVIPSSLLYALAGHELERLTSTADILTPRTAAVLAALALAALLPPLMKRRLARGKA